MFKVHLAGVQLQGSYYPGLEPGKIACRAIGCRSPALNSYCLDVPQVGSVGCIVSTGLRQLFNCSDA
jgi:hypothetical protein